MFSRLMRHFYKHDLFTISASVVFFAILSLPAMIMLNLKVFSALSLDLKSSVLRYLNRIMSDQSVSILVDLMDSVSTETPTGNARKILLIAILCISAITVFSQVQSGLNVIFHDVKKKDIYASDSAVVQFVYRKLACFGLFIGLILLLVLSVVISSLILSHPDNEVWWAEFWYELGSFLFLSFSFALIFWLIPDAQISIRSAITGGFVTSIFFTIGKFFIQFYLSSTKVGSEYGTASSVVLFMSWLFYATLMFFLGAEVIDLHQRQVMNQHEGSSNEAQSV